MHQLPEEIGWGVKRCTGQINSLFAAVAYPILSQSGDLLDSRLAQDDGS